MSYDSSSLIESGTGFDFDLDVLLYGINKQDNDNISFNHSTKKRRVSKEDKYMKFKRKHTAIQLVAGLNSNEAIQESILKQILLEKLDDAIYSYQFGDSSPQYMYAQYISREYTDIAKDENAIFILISNLFQNHQAIYKDITPTQEFIENIEKLINDIGTIYKDEIVYDRVGRVQKFIHNIIIDKYGEYSHYNLEVQDMKDLLSAVRLHLNIYDIKKLNLKSLLEMQTRTMNTVAMEIKSPKEYIPRQNKKFRHLWRATRTLSLLGFYKKDYIQDVLSATDSTLPLDEFKKAIINYYVNLN